LSATPVVADKFDDVTGQAPFSRYTLQNHAPSNRCCCRTRQARRPDAPRACNKWPNQRCRHGGLRILSAQPLPRSACPGSDQKLRVGVAGTPSRVPSAVSAGRGSCRRTACATGTRFVASSRSAEPRRQPADPDPARLQSAAASIGSLLGCFAFQPVFGPGEFRTTLPSLVNQLGGATPN
jgi:hypothetical protein